ncbi:nickel-dependent hydrogenase, large subunit [Klebsiella pneumoniae]|nr:nickel-dependent hydrogenase, large subunit [Klebsiella pneumoniae]
MKGSLRFLREKEYSWRKLAHREAIATGETEGNLAHSVRDGVPQALDIFTHTAGGIAASQ